MFPQVTVGPSKIFVLFLSSTPRKILTNEMKSKLFKQSTKSCVQRDNCQLTDVLFVCFFLPLIVDVIISNKVSVSIHGEQPMDLRVTQRFLHPGPDSAMLAPHPPFFLGPLTSQHCSKFPQPHLQVGKLRIC